MPPKVSIATITYNHQNQITKALDSFLAQKTNFDFEIIVSDDCSTDDTPKIVQEYIKKYPNKIKLITATQNVGLTANVQRVLTHCTAPYIAWCDGDDYWTYDQKLQKQVDFLDQNPQYIGCFNNVIVDYQTTNPPKQIPRNKIAQNLDSLLFNNPTDYNYDLPVYDNFFVNRLHCSAFMFRSFENYNFFSDIKHNLSVDWRLMVYCFRKGKIKYIPETWGINQKHAEGITIQVDTYKYTQVQAHMLHQFLTTDAFFEPYTRHLRFAISEKNLWLYYFHRRAMRIPQALRTAFFAFFYAPKNNFDALFFILKYLIFPKKEPLEYRNFYKNL